MNGLTGELLLGSDATSSSVSGIFSHLKGTDSINVRFHGAQNFPITVTNTHGLEQTVKYLQASEEPQTQNVRWIVVISDENQAIRNKLTEINKEQHQGCLLNPNHALLLGLIKLNHNGTNFYVAESIFDQSEKNPKKIIGFGHFCTNHPSKTASDIQSIPEDTLSIACKKNETLEKRNEISRIFQEIQDTKLEITRITQREDQQIIQHDRIYANIDRVNTQCAIKNALETAFQDAINFIISVKENFFDADVTQSLVQGQREQCVQINFNSIFLENLLKDKTFASLNDTEAGLLFNEQSLDKEEASVANPVTTTVTPESFEGSSLKALKLVFNNYRDKLNQKKQELQEAKNKLEDIEASINAARHTLTKQNNELNDPNNDIAILAKFVFNTLCNQSLALRQINRENVPETNAIPPFQQDIETAIKATFDKLQKDFQPCDTSQQTDDELQEPFQPFVPSQQQEDFQPSDTSQQTGSSSKIGAGSSFTTEQVPDNFGSVNNESLRQRINTPRPKAAFNVWQIIKVFFNWIMKCMAVLFTAVRFQTKSYDHEDHHDQTTFHDPNTQRPSCNINEISDSPPLNENNSYNTDKTCSLNRDNLHIMK